MASVGILRTIPITQHHVWTTDGDFTKFADRALLTGLRIDDLHFDQVDRRTNRTGYELQRMVVAGKGRCFGQAVAFVYRHAELLVPQVADLNRQRCRGGKTIVDRSQVSPLTAIEKQLKHHWHTIQLSYLMIRNESLGFVEVESGVAAPKLHQH